ncbi:MAG: SpoIIE family protein phosphatase [Bacteroidales bacterium]|nr:SpoIIE family protein phosphatase [Candidatus Latescibacterota bacterium]
MSSQENKTNILKDENERLKAAIEELSILNDISTAINSTLSLEEIIELIVKKCVKHIGAEQGTVTLLDSMEQKNPFQTMIRQVDRSSDFLPLHLDTQITGWILVNRKPLLINDMESNEHVRIPKNEENPVNTLLSVPLLLKGRVIGSLNLFNRNTPGGFTDADKRLLSIIATQSAQVIENARLIEEEKSLLHLQEEMKMAFKIQMGLLPKEKPAIDGYDIAGKSIPAKTVGGDYYDFIMAGDGRIMICLGDVSGKGMPAALLMSNLQATFRGQDLSRHTPCEIMSRSNKLLFRSTDPDKFATFFFGLLDNTRHEFHYCNAGHNNPILTHKNGDHYFLDTGGLILGALEESTYTDTIISLAVGDTLLVFSDGISEARNPSDEEYCEERILEVLTKNPHLDAAGIVDHIINEVNTFADSRDQMDDMTVVAMKRLF